MKLTSAQDAIKQAIEGGYPLFEEGPVEVSATGTWPMVYAKKNGVDKLWPLSGVLTDPLFWQALGKARGWRIYDKTTYDKRMVNRGMMDEWNRHARDWFETRMSGGDEKKL